MLSSRSVRNLAGADDAKATREQGKANARPAKMTNKRTKLRVLFLCTGNSCRSQMAEGWARKLKPDTLEPFSAGTNPHGLNPLAVEAMAEAGVDISMQRSKHYAELKDLEFDYVVTVCDSASETCPAFPSRTNVIHVGFDDPPVLARGTQSAQEALPHYRRVRDEIRAFIDMLPDALTRHSAENPR